MSEGEASLSALVCQNLRCRGALFLTLPIQIKCCMYVHDSSRNHVFLLSTWPCLKAEIRCSDPRVYRSLLALPECAASKICMIITQSLLPGPFRRHRNEIWKENIGDRGKRRQENACAHEKRGQLTQEHSLEVYSKGTLRDVEHT